MKAKNILISNLILISIVTLFPFNFSLIEEISIVEIWQRFNNPTYPLDLIINVVLFIPFGFSCSLWMHERGIRWKTILLATFASSVFFSLTIEVLQVFLPLRSSTKSDLVTNILGGMIGYSCSYFLSISLSQLRKILKAKYLWLSLIAYFTIIVIITIPLPSTTNLGNWDSQFPLLLGNEATEDRPWNGYIAQLSIFDRDFAVRDINQFLTEGYVNVRDADSLLVSYTFSEQESFVERKNQSPILTWRGQNSIHHDDRGVYLSENHWLATPVAPTLMTNRIRQSSKFTIYADLALATLQPPSSARIISVSKDPYHRNLTIEQQRKDLVFRLRNPFMGKNGSNFKLKIPNLFNDTNHHHLAITYDNSIVKIYIDKLSNLYSWKLMPEAALFKDIFLHYQDDINILYYAILYYLMVFVPIGMLLALLSIVSRGHFIFRSILISLGTILPSGIVQILLVHGSNNNLNLSNFFLSIAIVLISFFLVRMTIFLKVPSVLQSAQ